MAPDRNSKELDAYNNFTVFEGLDAGGSNWQVHLIEKNVGVSPRLNLMDIDADGDVDLTADGNAEERIYLWVSGSMCGETRFTKKSGFGTKMR
jgi:hypothetical protein